MEQQKLESAQTVVGSKSADKKRNVTVGSVWESKLYGRFDVVDYHGCESVIVRFIETGFETKSTSQAVRNGNIKDRLARSVFGVGFIGDGKYNSGHKHLDAYRSWHGMLMRCYYEPVISKHKTYIGCTVCDDWHDFQKFANWYYENYPDDEFKYDLDKDLKVIGNKVYSPETCLFVRQGVNKFVMDAGAARGQFMIGVTFEERTGRFVSVCSEPSTGRQRKVGRFSTEVEAHLAWRKRKSDYAYELAISQENIEVKNALLNWRAALDNFEIHKMDTGNYYEAL